MLRGVRLPILRTLALVLVIALIQMLAGVLPGVQAGPAGQTPGNCTEFFTAVLNGGQEVPPVNTPATGTASIGLYQLGPPNPTFHADVYISTTALDPARVTAAHIHAPAPPGVNAPIVVDLFTGPVGSFTTPFNRTVTPTGTLLTQMQSGLAYINIRTLENPGGEIRGQVRAGRGGDRGDD